MLSAAQRGSNAFGGSSASALPAAAWRNRVASVLPLFGQLHLEELAVHPSQQAKGLGTALVRAVITEARQRGGTSLTLTTFRFVAWNAPWYERLRFRVLAPQELSASLRAILDREALLGLAPERRVAMRLELTSTD